MSISRREMIKLMGAAVLLPFSGSLFSSQNSGNMFYYQLSKKARDENWIKLPINELMTNIALEFIDVPYVGGTLDMNETEECTVFLDKLDCVTYFETVLGIAKCFKAEKFEFEDLIHQVQLTRYRKGVINNYTSRLHYTADWIYYNTKNKIVKDITKDIGGVKIKFDTFFMSKNPDKYKSLTKNPEFVPLIKQQEDAINKRDYYYIPKSKISNNFQNIKSCDIIAITTSIAGLDYSHTGFAYRDKNDNLLFLHASSAKKKVTLDTYLSKYLANKSKDTGITVLRPL
jgi:hypothetical protein